MSALAHVFEAAGLSTVVLASMKEVVERMAPPRALYCEFPLGRPLGRPDDVELQRDVLERALALLDSPESPVLETFPDVITSEVEEIGVSPAEVGVLRFGSKSLAEAGGGDSLG